MYYFKTRAEDPPPAHLEGSIRFVDVDGILVSTSAHLPQWGQRTLPPARQDSPAAVQMAFPVYGRLDLSTPGRALTLGPPDFVVCDAPERLGDPPYAGRGAVEAIVIQIPRARLRLHADRIEGLLGTRLSGSRGIGAILRAYAVELADRLGECQPADTARLAAATLDLVGAAFAQHVDTQEATALTGHQRVLRTRIDAFIQRHLADPDLCPHVIAVEHRISLRYLYKLFQDEERSVAATIRQRRLEGCRLDLASPGIWTRPIKAISARWGFADAAQFSRAFRQGYGMSPSDYRGRMA